MTRLWPSWPGLAPPGLDFSRCSLRSVDGGLEEVREVFSGRCRRSTSSISSSFWTHGHQRGRNHITGMAEGADVPVKPISSWTSLIANVEGFVLALQLSQEPLNRRRRGLDLAEIAHLPLSTALRDGHGVLGFGRIEADVSYSMVVHGPSSLA